MMGAPAEAGRAVPVIYCTDLFHPHDDPDDHFDLATLYAMPELDIKGMVLDQGRKQLERPGRIPVSQLNRITGRNVPAVIGLADAAEEPGRQGARSAGGIPEGRGVHPADAARVGQAGLHRDPGQRAGRGVRLQPGAGVVPDQRGDGAGVHWRGVGCEVPGVQRGP